jgi:hypothetical protein
MFQHIRRHLLSETITTPSTISLALTSHLPIHPPTLSSRDDHNFRRHLICTGSFSIPLPPTLARKRSRLEDNISSASEFRSTRLLPLRNSGAASLHGMMYSDYHHCLTFDFRSPLRHAQPDAVFDFRSPHFQSHGEQICSTFASQRHHP